MFYIVVPTPNVTVIAPNTQTVGQSLTLQCKVTTVRGITSRVDIVWRNSIGGDSGSGSGSGNELQRMNNVSSTTIDNSLVYTDSYTISQLSTTDECRVIQCEVVINASPSVMASDSITLDVTGEYMTFITILFVLFYNIYHGTSNGTGWCFMVHCMVELVVDGSSTGCWQQKAYVCIGKNYNCFTFLS